MPGARTDLVKILEELKAHLNGCSTRGCKECLQTVDDLIAENTLPVGKIVLGQICCPKGHPNTFSHVEPSTFSHVEPSTITRSVDYFDSKNGRLEVEGEYEADDETDGSEAYLLCGYWLGKDPRGRSRYCETAFTLPPGIEIEFV